MKSKRAERKCAECHRNEHLLNTRYKLEIHITQERQHSLTGQHAANFKCDLGATEDFNWGLLEKTFFGCMFAVIKLFSISLIVAAPWGEVCNARASNEGQSLCVQISRERSYPLPNWYHSKGYNFAADSLYIMKLCSRLLVLYCRKCTDCCTDSATGCYGDMNRSNLDGYASIFWITELWQHASLNITQLLIKVDHLMSYFSLIIN